MTETQGMSKGTESELVGKRCQMQPGLYMFKYPAKTFRYPAKMFRFVFSR